MKTTVSVYDFRNAFQNIRPDNFSYEGLGLLFEYLEEFEQDTGEELELDVIAICCDFSEDTWEEIAHQYDIDLDDCEDDEEKQQAVTDYLIDEGVYIGTASNCIVYRQF